MIVKIPKVSIWAEGIGYIDNITITNVSFVSSIFEKGTASITFYEKPNRDGKFCNIWDTGGKWIIMLKNGYWAWSGYVTNIDSQRYGKIMKRNVSLTDSTMAWDVLVKDKIYPSSPNSSYTVGNLISDLANDAASASGVALGTIPDNPTPLSDILDAGVYTIRSSTYLAEIQKVLTWMGYKLYADPYYDQINIIDPSNTPPFGSLNVNFNNEYLLSSSFDIDYENIATTVVVGDSITGKAVAYGHLADHSDNTNYNIRKIEKIAFVTTYGVKDEKLSDIAQNVYNLSRRGCQKLKLSVAGFLGGYIWNSLSWSDANGNEGSYKIVKTTTNIMPTEITTDVEAII